MLEYNNNIITDIYSVASDILETKLKTQKSIILKNHNLYKTKLPT